MLVAKQFCPGVPIHGEGIGHNCADPTQYALRRQIVVELFVVDAMTGLDDGEFRCARSHVPVVDGRQPGWRRGKTHAVCGLFSRTFNREGIGLVYSRSLLSRLHVIMNPCCDWSIFLGDAISDTIFSCACLYFHYHTSMMVRQH